MPSERARSRGAASYRTKQVIVLAADVVLDAVRGDGREPEAVTGGLIADGVLPGCYRHRYDERFLEVFHSVVELTRNSLVSDLPHVTATAGVLAAIAILREARETLACGGRGREHLAAAIDPGLPEQLARNGERLRSELSELEGAGLEDTDVLVLFSLSDGQDSGEHLDLALREEERALLRFENWLVPFGNPPRPRIAQDGRAWPS